MSDNNVISVGAFDSEESFDVWLSGLDGEFKKKDDRYLDFWRSSDSGDLPSDGLFSRRNFVFRMLSVDDSKV